MNALMTIQTLPFSKDNIEDLVIEEVINYIKEKGFTYEVCTFETAIEGELSELIKLIEEINELCIEKGADSILSIIKLLYSPKGVKTIEEKVRKYK